MHVFYRETSVVLLAMLLSIYDICVWLMAAKRMPPCFLKVSFPVVYYSMLLLKSTV